MTRSFREDELGNGSLIGGGGRSAIAECKALTKIGVRDWGPNDREFDITRASLVK